MLFLWTVCEVCHQAVSLGRLQLAVLQQEGAVLVVVLPLAQAGQVAQGDVDVLEGVEEEDAADDGEEAAQVSQDVLDLHRAPLLEQDKGGHHDKGGKEHIVDGRHHSGVESVQGTVEVVELDEDADDDDEEENVEHPVGEFVVAAKGVLEADPHTLAAHDGEGAQAGADGDVHQHVLVAIARGRVKHQKHRHHHHQSRVHNEPWNHRCNGQHQ